VSLITSRPGIWRRRPRSSLVLKEWTLALPTGTSSRELLILLASVIAETPGNIKTTRRPSKEQAVTRLRSLLGRMETKISSLRRHLNTPFTSSHSEENLLLKNSMESNWMNSAEKRSFLERSKVSPELKEFLFLLIHKLDLGSLPPLLRTLKTLKSFLLRIDLSNIPQTETLLTTLLSLTTSGRQT